MRPRAVRQWRRSPVGVVLYPGACKRGAHKLDIFEMRLFHIAPVSGWAISMFGNLNPNPSKYNRINCGVRSVQRP